MSRHKVQLLTHQHFGFFFLDLRAPPCLHNRPCLTTVRSRIWKSTFIPMHPFHCLYFPATRCNIQRPESLLLLWTIHNSDRASNDYDPLSPLLCLPAVGFWNRRFQNLPSFPSSWSLAGNQQDLLKFDTSLKLKLDDKRDLLVFWNSLKNSAQF